MRRIILALAIVGALVAPASASASAQGAANATFRELKYDYGSSYGISVSCRGTRTRNYYTCKLFMHDRRGSTWEGRARVWQSGSYYSISYRLHRN